MRLYDFSIFAKRRDERRAASAVVEAVSHINEPGAVVVLKERVSQWCKLHQEILETRKVG